MVEITSWLCRGGWDPEQCVCSCLVSITTKIYEGRPDLNEKIVEVLFARQIKMEHIEDLSVLIGMEDFVRRMTISKSGAQWKSKAASVGIRDGLRTTSSQAMLLL